MPDGLPQPAGTICLRHLEAVNEVRADLVASFEQHAELCQRVACSLEALLAAIEANCAERARLMRHLEHKP